MLVDKAIDQQAAITGASKLKTVEALTGNAADNQRAQVRISDADILSSVAKGGYGIFSNSYITMLSGVTRNVLGTSFTGSSVS
jgi:hypothetical protein